MKTLLTLICCGVLLGRAIAAEPAKESAQQEQVAALAKEVRAQQVAIADNQSKIDAKLVAIGEALRLAKIYASRSGK